MTVDAVAAALDPRESDLERLAAAEIEARLAATGVAVAAQADQPGTLPPLRGRPLWGSFLTTALVAIGLELLLLGWWRR